ncbi:alpha/beta fold hydrolase [Pollutimonas thiosulfatoxidans]|uniref:AB hydrolase-1 domain-containing protein n=1 Tax=Pollutimonas thiosulfatoxidans TaxID=2028345 RepID=A0A410GD39_9BURK|nr:alpha/beta fold hydrolase [Pollutimonas thiosulfatoxidans]QAA94217.1 hypothetical protein CKA81_10515 [Pollutimonas thiosulfatoxidans]
MFFRLSNGRRIWYELLGEPEAPVVCLTHSLTADSGMWAEQVPALLQSGYRVLRMDIRGHGASEAVAGPYSLDDLADDVADVVNGLALGAVHYVGLSIGGMFGQAFAAKHQHLLRSLTLCDTLPSSAAGAVDMWNERIAVAREADSLAPLADATLIRWFTEVFRSGFPLRYQQFNESILATSLDGFEGCARAMQDFDFSSVLPGLRTPALVLCGADDPSTPPSENKRLAALIPGAHYVELDGCRHLPNVEKPSDFNTTLLRWLKSQD